MEVKIYLDVLFLVNFAFDFLLLYLCSLVLKKPPRRLRIFSAAIFGGAYSLALFFFKSLPMGGFYGKILSAATMIYLAFSPKTFRSFIQYICVFLAFVCLTGGAAFLFFHSGISSRFGAVYHNGILYVNFPVFLWLLLSFCCYVLLKILFALGNHFTAMGQKIFTLKIVYGEKTLLLRGLYDSGNLLTDDVQGKGVIVTEWSALQKFFPKRSFETLVQESHLHLLPFETLTGKATLPAFLPDEIFIKHGNTFFKTETVYIGLVNHGTDRYHHWNAILPQDFKGVTSYETAVAHHMAQPHQKKKRPDSDLAQRDG